ncbi:hypothetical protein J3R82DRAFT_10921 [Butyriboletus roseoflavus]|nr:hypothetical protein J3R82DRAFT_10921 [Butyriboletus roseoflavus]
MGRGSGLGRGRGRGRGRGQANGGDPSSASRCPRFGGVGVNSKARTSVRNDAPLSDLLYSERPLLRPVKFVRSTLTPFLFQYAEEVLEPAPQAADTTETSHAPIANRVARLFHTNAPNSDSGSEDHAEDALEEIDFANLAKVRAEVDAIAQGIAMLDKAARRDQDDIEEVDFADLAAIRAKVDSDAAEIHAVSRDDRIEEAFTGVYNQIKDTRQVSSPMDVVDDDQPHGVQQTIPLPLSPTLDDSLDFKPSTETPDLSNHESFPHTQDTIVVGEGVPCSSNASPNTPVEESPQSIPPGAPYDDTDPLFVVDTSPTRPFTGRSASDVILVDRTGHGEALGDQDEERIVYVAPHPRSGRVSRVPAIPRVKLPQTSMLIGMSLETGGLRSPVREDDCGPVPSSDRDRDRTHTGLEGETGEEHYLSLASLTLGPTPSATTSSPARPTPARANAALRARKKLVWIQRQEKRGLMGFGALGAMVSEARLREEDVRERRRPRWEMRRKGDSDVDWGTEDEDEDGESENEEGEEMDELDAVSNGLGGMEIDPDLVMDVNAMQGFMNSMEGSRFVTMDDLEDEAQMRREDEEGEGGPEGSSCSERSDEEEARMSEEEEEAFNIEEENFIAESEGDDELSEDSDDELSPRSSFQARLRKVRERSRSQHPMIVQESMPSTHGADDENIIAHIKDLLEKNSQILSDRASKEKQVVFRDQHEEYVDDSEFTTPVNKKKKNKGKQATGHFATELNAQWAKDRAKKAEHKKEREAARLRAALDPLSADANTGNHGRTSRKAMSAAAHLDPDAARSVAPGAIVDMVTLETQMRRFIEDVGGRKSLALPPMDNKMRKEVHEMAHAFGLKSESKGKGSRRYTTLFKTSRTGLNERKVKATMKRNLSRGGQIPRHQEGYEVGKDAPEIRESNVGFRMLASMGWSEGVRIGGTGSVGIDAPLTAIVKNSKLGLGATRG